MEQAVVIVSTYNGDRFLQVQIDSLLSQEGINVNLVIRDDGSSDNTCEIIRNYIKKHKEIVFSQGDNVGCKKSFYLAAKQAYDTFKDIEYFAFSDQDDFWMPDKLACGITSIKNLGQTCHNLPLLYFCAPEIVDKDLIPIDKKWNSNHFLNFEEACLAQPCAGCTMVFNRKALELFLLASPDKMSMHDSWLYKSVLACGGCVVEDAVPHIKYRQHGNNVIGTGSFHSRWKRRFQNFTGKNSYRSEQVRGLLEYYSDIMPESILLKARTLADYKNNSFFNKLKIVFNPDFRTKSHIHNLLFRIAILFNRF